MPVQIKFCDKINEKPLDFQNFLFFRIAYKELDVYKLAYSSFLGNTDKKFVLNA